MKTSVARVLIQMRSHLTSLLKDICKLATITHIYIMNRRHAREITCLMSSTTIPIIYGKTYIFIISKWNKFCSLTSETFCNHKCLILTNSNSSILTITRPKCITINNKMYLKNINTINSNRSKMEVIFRWWCSNPHSFCKISNYLNPFIMVCSLLQWETTKEANTSLNK